MKRRGIMIYTNNKFNNMCCCECCAMDICMCMAICRVKINNNFSEINHRYMCRKK